MLRLMLCCGLLIAPTTAASQTPSIWTLDSTVDQMSDSKVISASLSAAQPLTYSLGVLRPTVLTAICFTEQSDQNPNNMLFVHGLNVLFVSQASPTIASVGDDGTNATDMTVRFDSDEPREYGFWITNVGGGGSMIAQGWLDDQYHSVPGRSCLVPRMLNARRLLIRYTLITDETLTAEFDFGPDTRGAVEHVFNACGQQLPN